MYSFYTSRQQGFRARDTRFSISHPAICCLSIQVSLIYTTTSTRHQGFNLGMCSILPTIGMCFVCVPTNSNWSTTPYQDTPYFTGMVTVSCCALCEQKEFCLCVVEVYLILPPYRRGQTPYHALVCMMPLLLVSSLVVPISTLYSSNNVVIFVCLCDGRTCSRHLLRTHLPSSISTTI